MYLQVENGAGLSSLVVSPAYILDSSPPVRGVIYDGPQPNQGDVDVFDLDYTTSLTTLYAHWQGFSDPHSAVVEYFWAIGTCSLCSDVQTFTSIGSATGKYPK